MKIDQSWYVRQEGVREEISAGGVVACIKNGRIFIALIHENTYPDFVLPKGHVEKGESLEQAAIREIEEETGLKNLKLICRLGVKERLDFKKDYWKKTHYFLFTCKCGDNPKVKWFPLNDLPKIFWPEQKQLIEENRQKILDLVI